MHEYDVVITGKDEQFEAALAELMKIVKSRKRYRICAVACG